MKLGRRNQMVLAKNKGVLRRGSGSHGCFWRHTSKHIGEVCVGHPACPN
jgi:hypothetical protein